jgi:hypothetical protein
MSPFKFDYISQYCPHLANVNLCDTPFCENDVQVIVRECRELKELRVGMKSTPGTKYVVNAPNQCTTNMTHPSTQKKKKKKKQFRADRFLDLSGNQFLP